MKKILLALAAVGGIVALGYGGYKLATRNKDKKQDDNAPDPKPEEKPVDQPAPAEPEKPAVEQPNQEAQA